MDLDENLATCVKATLRLDNVLHREPEPEDALFADSEALEQLVAHVKLTAQDTEDWEQALYAL